MKVIVFGTKNLASSVWHALAHDSEHEVVGFTVDRAYLTERTLHGLPVVPFEEVDRHFPSDAAAMIVPLGASRLNGLRAEKHLAAKTKGYRIFSHVSPRANTWPDLKIGENCFVWDGSNIQPFVRLGDGVLIRVGATVSHHVEIGNNCFLAAEACVGGAAKIGERCFLGLNCTIRDGVTVAARCFVAAGAVVVADTEENGVYAGVPAKRRPEPAETFKAF
jgi:sugar O-acyltransferase (sialic acid O-acetyltransferase NeuD family)